MQVREMTEGKTQVCRRVLDALPDWFGRPEAVERYVKLAEESPVLGVREGEASWQGLVVLTEHNERNCELAVVGVLPHRHRQGLGTALVEASAERACRRGFRYLTVKTLSGAHPDPGYAATRAFYRACGFLAFEELPDLWGPDAPCLMMIRELRR